MKQLVGELWPSQKYTNAFGWYMLLRVLLVIHTGSFTGGSYLNLRFRNCIKLKDL